MNIRIVGIHIRRITDQLAYNEVYGPDEYPSEDRTSLQKQEEEIRASIKELLGMVKREDMADWIKLAYSCVANAFEKYREGDDSGTREIQSAMEYLQNAMLQKPHKIDFVIKPDGTAIAETEE